MSEPSAPLDPDVPNEALPWKAGTQRRRWWPRILLGCTALIVLGCAAVAFAVYRFIQAPPPAQRTTRAVTPTRAPRPAPDEPHTHDATVPAGSAQPIDAAPSPPPGARSAPADEVPRLPLEQDAERRQRISARVQQALAQRRTQAQRPATSPDPAKMEPPVLDTTLPAPVRLQREDPGEAADLGPFLAQRFAPPVAWSIKLPGKPFMIRAADLDGDGQAELACLDFDGRRILFYGLAPDGTYRLRGMAATDPWPQDIVFADLDGNGLTDIALPGGSARSTILLNQGHWQFAYRLALLDQGAARVVAMDINSDGATDLLFGTGQGIVPFLNDGSGTLARGDKPYEGRASLLTTADLNGDGVREIVALPWVNWRAPPAETSIAVVSLDDTGRPIGESLHFHYSEAIWRLRPLQRPHAVGHDLIGTVVGRNDVLLLTYQPDGTLATEVIAESRGSSVIIVTDLTGDGWEDAIVGSRVFVHDGRTLVPRARFPGKLWPSMGMMALLTDDDIPDLALYDNESDHLLIYAGRKPPAEG